MVRLRSAVNQKQRPSASLRMEPDPHGDWTKVDYLLLDAFYILDSEYCTLCNNPIWLCHSTDNSIDFTVKTRTCYAKAEIEEYEKSKRGKDLGSGQYLIATPNGIEDEQGQHEPLPKRHEAYKRMPN